jgi:hypothetical protein
VIERLGGLPDQIQFVVRERQHDLLRIVSLP